jgi:hypothetical protein
MKRYVCLTTLLLAGILLSQSFVLAAGGVDDSLVMYLPMEEAKGKNLEDFSAFQHEAEIRGGGKIVPDGAHGNCVELNGKDAIVYVKDHEAFETEEATIEIWFKTESGSNFPIMWKERGATGGDWWVRIEPGSNRIRCLFRDTADQVLIVFTESPYNDNKWHHMAATVGPKGANTKTAKIYIDGELDAKSAEAKGAFGEMKSTESVTLGSRFADAPDTFGLGWLDEARVWSRALTPEEIKANMELSKDEFLAVSPAGKLATRWGDVKRFSIRD